MRSRSPFEELEVKPHWKALAALPFVGMLGLVALAAAVGSAAPLFGLIHLSIFGALAGWYVARHTALMRRSGTELRIDEQGVWRGTELVLRRDDVAQGFVRPDHDHGHVLHVAKKGAMSRDVRIAVDDEATGREALRTLGVDASQKVATMRAASRLFSLRQPHRTLVFMSPILFVPLLIAGGMIGQNAGAMGPILLAPFLVIFGALMAVPSRVDIGVDGVLVRWLGRRRFVPFDRVVQIEHFEERDLNKVYLGVRLHLEDGSSERIVTGQKRFDADASKNLASRIEQALEAYRRGAGELDASVLARRDRHPLEWVRGLRALTTDAQVGPRRAPVAPERLLRIAVDPSASPTARASAAIAVAPAMTHEDRARLRVASGATASPKLRIALERAAAEDEREEGLAEILAELEAEDAATRARG